MLVCCLFWLFCFRWFFFFLFLNLLGQANQIEVTSEQWRSCFILSWDSFLLLCPFLSVHLREPKVLVRQQCCTVLPATRKLLDGCWAGTWMLIVAVWPAWFFWLGLTGPIVLPSKGSATIPPSLLSSSTVLLKHLLGRKGLPSGWGLHGSGSYLPVVGHSLTERTGTSGGPGCAFPVQPRLPLVLWSCQAALCTARSSPQLSVRNPKQRPVPLLARRCSHIRSWLSFCSLLSMLLSLMKC